MRFKDDNYVIGQRIRRIRRVLGLTQYEFGQLLGSGKTNTIVSHWENGYFCPNAENLKRIAEVGNTTIHELVEPEAFLDINKESANVLHDVIYPLLKHHQRYKIKQKEFDILKNIDEQIKEIING